jgi:hypothetical protein
MQRVLFHQTGIAQLQSQASRVLPRQGTGVHGQAVNDDVYDDGISPVRMVFAVLGNMIGGTLLLSGMFVLPHVLAGFLG